MSCTAVADGRDLHPRWSPDDRQICFDPVHEGHRRVYLMDVSSLWG
jgi:Tol biopolymer transport system component